MFHRVLTRGVQRVNRKQGGRHLHTRQRQCLHDVGWDRRRCRQLPTLALLAKPVGCAQHRRSTMGPEARRFNAPVDHRQPNFHTIITGRGGGLPNKPGPMRDSVIRRPAQGIEACT